MNFAVDALIVFDATNPCVIDDPILEVVTTPEGNDDSFESGVISYQGKQVAFLQDTVCSEGGLTGGADVLIFDVVGGFGDVDHLG